MLPDVRGRKDILNLYLEKIPVAEGMVILVISALDDSLNNQNAFLLLILLLNFVITCSDMLTEGEHTKIMNTSNPLIKYL